MKRRDFPECVTAAALAAAGLLCPPCALACPLGFART
jgi:hypothetical protein